MKTALLITLIGGFSTSDLYIGVYTTTAYRSVESQTDDSPFYTSIGERVHPGGIAVSPDLLETGVINYGDMILINSSTYTVNDCTNEKLQYHLDIWVENKKEEKNMGVRNKPASLIQNPVGKTCAQCKLFKPYSEFYSSTYRVDGYRFECKICSKINNHNQHIKFRDIRIEKSCQYQLLHRKEATIKALKWQRADRFRYRAIVSNFRARRYGQLDEITKEQLEQLLQIQKDRCNICKRNIKKDWTVDHIVPFSKEGSNNISNIQLLCGSCNTKKGIKEDK